MNVIRPRLVEIYRTTSLAKAHGIKMELEEEGLQVFLDGDLLQGALGELPLGWATAIRISVQESQKQLAQEYLAKSQAHLLAAAQNNDPSVHHCLACGQVMQETDTTCSACGWSFESRDKDEC